MIQAVGISKIFGKGESRVQALLNIDLIINNGDFISVVGASGSGKSTLLHILSGLENPTSGKVLYDRQNISNLSPAKLADVRRKNIGFVFQFFNLVPILTVEENILLPVLMDGKKPDKQHIKRLVEALGLKSKMNTFPSKLSGGQQQRVAIARALSAKPSVVFADEPTGNLDSKTGKEILEIFQYTASAFNQTIVIVTHDINVAERASRLIQIEDGHIIKDEARGI